MFKKFLTLIGRSSVELTDGKVKFEMTEEEMEASGKIITERDEAVANLKKLQAELEAERQQNTTAQADFLKANKEKVALTAEVERLKGLGGASTIENTDATDGKGKADGFVVDDTKSMDENMEACGKAFGFIE